MTYAQEVLRPSSEKTVYNRLSVKPASSARRVARDLSVLLIEDTETDAFIVSRLLRRFFGDEIGIHRANSLLVAEQVLKGGGRTDLILLDLGLPDSQGPAETYRQMGGYMGQIPIIVLTSVEDHALAIGALGLGAQDYVHKNSIVMQPDLLCQAVEYSILRHQDKKKSLAELTGQLKETSELLELMSGGYSVEQ